LGVLCAIGTWLGWQNWQTHQVQTQRAAFIQAGRQAALNLTTINDTDVEADVQRILDGSTGTFHDDFHNRAQPFIDVVVEQMIALQPAWPSSLVQKPVVPVSKHNFLGLSCGYVIR